MQLLVFAWLLRNCFEIGELGKYVFGNGRIYLYVGLFTLRTSIRVLIVLPACGMPLVALLWVFSLVISFSIVKYVLLDTNLTKLVQETSTWLQYFPGLIDTHRLRD